jgi:DNA invertase Pin-like site-specific DNA recombinase
MRVAAYLRVSTDRQVEKGLGLSVQRTAIREWVRQHDHRLTATFVDEGISGAADLDRRVGLADALDAIRSGPAQGLVLYRLDRLARDYILQEQLMGEVWQLGGEVYSTSGTEQNLRDDPNDPARRLIRQVLAAISEYEKNMISLRLRAGRDRKAAGGGYACGRPPYGYRAAGGALVPDESEQQIVRLVHSLRADGLSLRDIAGSLAQEGHLTRQGHVFHPQVLSRILKRAGPSNIGS